MQSIAKSVMTGTDFEDIKQTIDIINSISVYDIKEITAKYLPSNNLSKVRLLSSL